jgi:hypothetical protein
MQRGKDIGDRKQTEGLHVAEKRTLEMIADAQALKDVLELRNNFVARKKAVRVIAGNLRSREPGRQFGVFGVTKFQR